MVISCPIGSRLFFSPLLPPYPSTQPSLRPCTTTTETAAPRKPLPALPANRTAHLVGQKDGGRLLLIADHMPFAGAAEMLGRSFGIEFLNCFANDNRQRRTERFYKGNGTLLPHSITQGIDTVVAFTGSAFRIPAGATPLLALKNYTLILPVVAWEFEENSPHLSGDGYYLGACLSYGKGRVVVMGEAAMFSAQLSGPNRNKVGMNTPEAGQNAQFLLNILHWLDE